MFSRNNLIFFHSDDELPSTAETEEEVGSSVSHTAPTTAGQPVFWKRKLTIVTSSKELNDVIKDAVKNTALLGLSLNLRETGTCYSKGETPNVKCKPEEVKIKQEAG
jgi:hypothetical protein